MKASKAPAVSYNAPAYIVAAVALAAAVAFCIVFFCLAQNLPDSVPVHWSAGGGFDKWGNKSELYHLGIIPPAFAAVLSVCSVLCIKKDFSGVSLFITVMMALSAALFFKACL